MKPTARPTRAVLLQKTNRIATVQVSQLREEESSHFSWTPRVLIYGSSVYVPHRFAFFSTNIHTTSAAPNPRRHPASNHLLSNGHEHLGYPNSRVSQLFVCHAKILPPSATSTADYALRCMVRPVDIFNMPSSDLCLAFPKIGPEYPGFTSRLALVPAYVVSFISENMFF